MSEPFLGEISILGFNFAPRGWALCDGQILPISQNQSLFSLLGTTYGGDGRTTFALPDLRGRTPLHFGQGAGLSDRRLGSKSGEEQHQLSVQEIPSHKHAAACNSAAGTSQTPVGNVPALEANMGIAVYGSPSNATLNTGVVANTGGGAGHENMQPFLTVSFAISLRGLFPSRN